MDDATALAAPGQASFIVGNQVQAAAALGISIETFRQLKSLPGFPGESGRYNIPAIKEWMGPLIDQDAEVDPTSDPEAAEELPQLVIERVTISIPLADPRPGSRWATLSGNIDVTLRGKDRARFRCLLQGLVADGARLEDDTPVAGVTHAIRWLLQQLTPPHPDRDRSAGHP